MIRYLGVTREQIRRWDGDTFFWHYNQVPRLRALDAISGANAAALGFSGGDAAKDAMEEYQRQVDQLPKIRLKAEASARIGLFLGLPMGSTSAR